MYKPNTLHIVNVIPDDALAENAARTTAGMILIQSHQYLQVLHHKFWSCDTPYCDPVYFWTI